GAAVPVDSHGQRGRIGEADGAAGVNRRVGARLCAVERINQEGASIVRVAGKVNVLLVHERTAGGSDVEIRTQGQKQGGVGGFGLRHQHAGRRRGLLVPQIVV